MGHRLEAHKSSVCWFLKEHDFIKDHDNLYHQRPVKHTVIATEDSTLVAKNLLNYHLGYHQKRISLLTIQNSTDRY